MATRIKNPAVALVGLLALLTTALCSAPTTAAAAEPSPGPILLEVEGRVDVAGKGTANWQPGQTNQFLQYGDQLRTGLRSRALLRLSELSSLRVKPLTTMEITPPEAAGGKPQLNLRSGATYFFSRERPGQIQFRSPVASGAIRGTEFNIEVDDNGRTVVTLLDGQIDLSNAQGDLSLTTGEQGIIEPGQAPRKTAVIDAINIIQWALYYPAVLAPDELGLTGAEAGAIGDSLDAYRSGDLLQALAAYPEGRAPVEASGKIYLAGILLAAGQVGESESLLDGIAADAPLASALREVISTVRQDPAAFTHPPSTASEWVARSYHLQSLSRLEEALEAARTAAKISPGFGAAHVRVAELEFGFGRTAQALAALNKGLSLSPRNAQGLALEGFLLSAKGRFEESLDRFERAIAIDGALGNAWLGRGLVRIRLGDREAGRADLQAAATLEPQRSILRSYLGKAFSHDGDPERAARELALASRLDEADPTPWLYSALLNQEQNRINEAIGDLERSQALNNNRSLHRSKLLLDQDQSVRSANLASIYRDAGMLDLSRREAARGVSYDYASFSSHLFLASSFDALRDPRGFNLRYESAWFSELLVAQLLAPVGAGNLSQNISQQEYSRLFEGNHLGIYSGTEYFSNGEWVQEGSQYGVIDRTSYSLDAYYRTDPGQRPNNDFEQLNLSIRLKQQLTPNDSVFFMANVSDTKTGDVSQYYNQASADTTLRVRERQEPNAFIGYHHQWKPGLHTLLLAGRLDDKLELDGSSRFLALTKFGGGAVIPFLSGRRPFTEPVGYTTDFEAYTVELQQIWQQGPHTLVAGGRYQTGESDLTQPRPLPPLEGSVDLERISGYAYEFFQVLPQLQLIGGISYDTLDYPENTTIPPISFNEESKDRWSPKAGFYLTPLPHTTLRGLYTRSLGGVFYDTSVRLEPTQLAGFNQAFRSIIPESVAGLVPGSEFETFGLAIDQEIPATRTYLSVAGEVLNSEAGRTAGAFVTTLVPGVPSPALPGGTPERLEFRERSVSFTLNQLIGDHYSIGSTYRWSDADFTDTFTELPGESSDVTADLHQVSLFGIVNLPCGFFGAWNSIWSQQSNKGYTPDIPGDDFWQHSVHAGYRFLGRRAEARVGLLNITDQDYQLNPLTLYSELPRERTLTASLRLFF